MNKKELEKLKSEIKDLKERDILNVVLEANLELADEQQLFDYKPSEVLAFYLYKCHELISTVSSELCGLSKSNYTAEVYIEQIKEYQEKLNNRAIRDEIMEIINDGEHLLMSDKEILEEIKKYLDGLNV